MKCPRCLQTELAEIIPNAISRRDNKTEICSRCGYEEAMIDAGYAPKDRREELFLRTLAMLKRKEK